MLQGDKPGTIIKVQRKGNNLVLICEIKQITLEPKEGFFFEFNEKITGAFLTNIDQDYVFDDEDESMICCARLLLDGRTPCFIPIRSNESFGYDELEQYFSVTCDDDEDDEYYDELGEEPKQAYQPVAPKEEVFTTIVTCIITINGNKHYHTYSHASNKIPQVEYNVKVSHNKEQASTVLCPICRQTPKCAVILNTECGCRNNYCLCCVRDKYNMSTQDFSSIFISCPTCDRVKYCKKTAADIYTVNHALNTEIDKLFVTTSCPRNCGVVMRYNDIQYHLSNECAKSKRLCCSECGKRNMNQEEKRNHYC